jgi:hypothetical protein
MCPEAQEPPQPPEEFSINYSANYPMTMVANSPHGIFQLYKNGSLTSSFLVGVSTVGKTQFVNDPQQLQNNVQSAMTSSSAQYSFELKLPSINVSTTAPVNATVNLQSKMKQDGVTVATQTFTYLAGPGGGPKQVSQEYPGGY